MIAATFPATAIIPTRNRTRVLERTLASLAEQSLQPARVVLVDASDDSSTEELCRAIVRREGRWSLAAFELLWRRAGTRGAAAQRNQAMADISGEAVLFMDDDVLFEPECIARMRTAFNADWSVGAVSPMITNEAFARPGLAWRLLLRWLAGRKLDSYAGRCVGPAAIQMPADDPSLPEIVPIDWMPTACALYRREALPTPLFDPFFTGYSYMEDAALSLLVGKNWKLVNARTARLYHDSQPGEHKADMAALSQMEMINRHHVMTTILGRDKPSDIRRLAVYEFARVISLGMNRASRWKFRPALRGKFAALREIHRGRRMEAQTS
ncbi:MAG TPA: glycosyltransferase [Opitutaceae bacterium]|nr:glycosyltransferase [Opitutaceae bacterium]